MGKMKQIPALFLALALLLCCCPIHPLATETVPSETAAAVTEPEETVPETPSPEETPPEETAPAETITETIPEDTIPGESIPETVPEITQEETAPVEEPKQSGPGLYFGRLHAHSSISSGTDAPEDIYRAAQAEGLDFFALCDHGDSISDEDWAALGSAAENASSPGFLALPGYEMNWPRRMQLGHITAFGTAGYTSWQQEGFGEYDNALENYYSFLASQGDAVGQFNHPGPQLGTFDSFGHYSADADSAMALLEIDFREPEPYQYYTKALDAGWHIAPTAGQESDAVTAVYTRGLTREALLEALRAYQAYATEDPDLEIFYTANGHPMGSRLKSWQIGEELELSVFLSDTAEEAAVTVEVITNGSTVLASKTLDAPEGVLSFSLPPEEGYYYLCITQSDGHRAVTAPIWVDTGENLGITDLICETAVPIRNEEICLTLEFSNGEDVDFQVETAEILVDGKPVHAISPVLAFPANAVSRRSFFFSCDCVGLTELTLRLRGTLEGTPQTYQRSLTVSFRQSMEVTGILVDSGHGNAGLDSLNILKALAQKEAIRVTVTENITPELLRECRFLLISAPSEPFSEEFLRMIAEFTGYGGSLILCSQAEMLDQDYPSAEALNQLLEAMGSTMVFHRNTARDPVTNGGLPHQLYLEDMDRSSPWCTGVTPDQVYRQFSGCTVDPGSGFPLVYGRATAQPEHGVVLAWEPLSGGGTVFAAGSLFLSDADLEVPKNSWDLPYTNRTIARNLLGIGGDAVSISSIQQARLAEDGELVRIRGHITVGTSNRYNTFPGCIYLQDDTGGIALVPFAEAGLQVGTPLDVMGYVQTLGGNRVLKLSDWKVLESTRYYHPPRTGDWAELLNPLRNGGTLVEVEGNCLEIYCREDDTMAGCLLADKDGNLARVQIGNEIFAGSDGKNELHEEICKGRNIRAMGILHVNEYGETVLRVRNCEEVAYVPPRKYYNPPTGDWQLTTAVSAMGLSLAGLLLLRNVKTPRRVRRRSGE